MLYFRFFFFVAKSLDVIQFSKKIQKKSFDICNTDLIFEIKVYFIIVE